MNYMFQSSYLNTQVNVTDTLCDGLFICHQSKFFTSANDSEIAFSSLEGYFHTLSQVVDQIHGWFTVLNQISVCESSPGPRQIRLTMSINRRR